MRITIHVLLVWTSKILVLCIKKDSKKVVLIEEYKNKNNNVMNIEEVQQ